MWLALIAEQNISLNQVSTSNIIKVDDLEAYLVTWKASLCQEIAVGGLFTRNEIVHKWKAPWRSLLLRESVAWRLQDLLEQSHILYSSSHLLGARILLRSGFETMAILIHLNQTMRQVVAGTLDFHEFSVKTSKLLLGSRDKTTNYEAINILTVIQKADKRYAGLEGWYVALSESAHPNYEGMLFGYSEADEHNQVTTYKNQWVKRYGRLHIASIEACISVFVAEYNNEFSPAFEALELWIEQNDLTLEATKPKNT